MIWRIVDLSKSAQEESPDFTFDMPELALVSRTLILLYSLPTICSTKEELGSTRIVNCVVALRRRMTVAPELNFADSHSSFSRPRPWKCGYALLLPAYRPWPLSSRHMFLHS